MSDDKQPEARIFEVETRFQRMARQPGGVSRDQALKRAQETIEELKVDFAGWLAQKLQDLEMATRRVERHPTNLFLIEKAHQNCCQIRDVGTTMGFELVTDISNNLCDILDAMKAGLPYEKEMIDCHLDALILSSKPPYCNLRADQLPEMTSGLRQIVERCNTSPTE